MFKLNQEEGLFTRFLRWIIPVPKSVKKKLLEVKESEETPNFKEFTASDLKLLASTHGKAKKALVKELNKKYGIKK